MRSSLFPALCNERGSQCAPPADSRHGREEDLPCPSADSQIPQPYLCQSSVRRSFVHDREASNGNEVFNENCIADVSKIVQDETMPVCSARSLHDDSFSKQLLYTGLTSSSSNGDAFISAGNPLTGVMSTRGLQSEMEDSVAVAHQFFLFPCKRIKGCPEVCGSNSNKQSAYLPWHFFGVYDGHGGSQVSNFCKEKLHVTLAKEMQEIMDAENTGLEIWQASWVKAIRSTFNKIDAEIVGAPEGTRGEREHVLVPLAPENVGSTAIVAIIGLCQIIVANCGDSRAVLCRGGQAIAMSDDHKPNRGDELERIEKAGGSVFNWNGYRVSGVLAMSRAIGDRYLKPYVIAEPEVKCVSRSEDDECLILASDGLWDVLSNEKVCEIASKCLSKRMDIKAASDSTCYAPESNDKRTEAVAALLTKVALSKGSEDNISVMVVNLKETTDN